MTETPVASINPDEIEDGVDRPSARLEREADRLLAEAEAREFDGGEGRPGVESVRAALRQDIADGRAWASQRGERVTTAIREDPIKATLYALGAGVLLGLLLRR